ncbi:MAG: hypothetical protein AAB477_00480 [Patescibacteria group bacterium]
MKFDIKKTIIVILVVINFTPILVFAKEPNKKLNEKASSQSGADGNFCGKIEDLRAKYAEQIAKLQENSSRSDFGREDELIKKESDLNAKLSSSRADIDNKRIKNWDKILKKAKSVSERAAVEKYQGVVSNAVLERRESIDKAVETYRNGLVSTMNTHSKTINDSILGFKSSVNEALSKSKASCLTKVGSKNAKDDFNRMINDAKRKLENTSKGVEATGLDKLKQARDEAIRLAESIYKLRIEKARADLLLVIK